MGTNAPLPRQATGAAKTIHLDSDRGLSNYSTADYRACIECAADLAFVTGAGVIVDDIVAVVPDVVVMEALANGWVSDTPDTWTVTRADGRVAYLWRVPDGTYG